MYLRNKVTGAITDNLDSQSLEYRVLQQMRIQAGQTEQGALSAVSAGGVYPLWEEFAQEDVGEDPALGRVIVLALGPAATAGTENTSDPYNPEVAGTATDIEWVPQAAYAGAVTNNRNIAVQQTTTAGTATVTRAVNTIGQKAMDNTVNVAQFVPVNIPVTAAAIAAGAPLAVVSSPNGTGIADPGGVVYITYTRA